MKRMMKRNKPRGEDRMTLVYGLRDGNKDENEKRFKALTDEEKEIYHNVLPFAMMATHISRITPNTIEPMRKRCEFRGYDDWAKLLTNEFLNKVIGFMANVHHHASARDWLIDLTKPGTGNDGNMTVYQKEKWENPIDTEKISKRIEEHPSAFIPLCMNWEEDLLEGIDEEEQPKSPAEALYFWIKDFVHQMEYMKRKEIIASLEYYIGTKKTTAYEQEIIEHDEAQSMRER